MNDQNVAPFEGDASGGFPPGFEPQVPLEPNQSGEIQQRDQDLIDAADEQLADVQPTDVGDADGGDDEAED